MGVWLVIPVHQLVGQLVLVVTLSALLLVLTVHAEDHYNQSCIEEDEDDQLEVYHDLTHALLTLAVFSFLLERHKAEHLSYRVDR